MESGYIALYKSGELERRAKALEARLAACDLCPRQCGANRLEDERGTCRTGIRAVVASVCAHHGEEPALSGSRGSGTIFFAQCNMRCVYCQNYQISQEFQAAITDELDAPGLAERMLYLQNKLGCHNINLVTPTHVVPQIMRALLEAIPLGLHIPLVYNSSGYDSLSTIKELDGIVNIYLPDLRYGSDETGLKYSGVPDYVEQSRPSIKEMYRQVGDLVVDEDGIAQRGVIVRHLILPDGLAGSKESLTWLASEVSPSVALSIMAQYFPAYKAPQLPQLSRKIRPAEYSEVIDLLDKLGLQNGWVQELDSSGNYQPDFNSEGHPFERARKQG